MSLIDEIAHSAIKAACYLAVTGGTAYTMEIVPTENSLTLMFGDQAQLTKYLH